MPDWNEAIRKELAALNLNPAREAEIAEELDQHAEDRYYELVKNGCPDTEAQRIALAETTDHALLADELRSVERTNVPEPIAVGGQAKVHLLDGLAHDFSYAVRSLKKSPNSPLWRCLLSRSASERTPLSLPSSMECFSSLFRSRTPASW